MQIQNWKAQSFTAHHHVNGRLWSEYSKVLLDLHIPAKYSHYSITKSSAPICRS